MATYSTNLFTGTAGSAAPQVVVDNTAGPNTIVVRDIEALESNGAPDLLFVYVNVDPTHQYAVTVLEGDGVHSDQWKGRIVIPPGYQLAVNTNNFIWNLCISGYSLTP